MSKVHFEKMLETDLDQVLAIEIQNYEVPWNKKTMASCLKADYHSIVMKQDDRIIGYAFLMSGYQESHLLNMCISNSCQNQGLGWRFLTYLQNICIYSHSKTFLLEVRVSNKAAQHLYRKFGFKEIGRRRNYYRCIKGKEDAIIMTKIFMEDSREQV